MATPINTANVAVSELQTAPGGATSSNMSFSEMAQRGWNEGTLGSATYPYYCWGLGFGTAGGGGDCIYGLTPLSGSAYPPFGLGLFRGLIYWFDGTTYDIKYQYINNKSAPPPLPPPAPPPSANDIQINNIVAMDSSSTYDVFAPFSINAVAASSLSSTTIPGFIANSSPLVRNVYWFVDLQTDPVFWPGGTLVVQVNGSTVYSGGISAGSSSVSWQTSGATSGSTNSSGILLDFDVS